VEPGTFSIPKLRTMARHALPHVIEGTVLPIGIFYLALWLAGFWGAVAASLAFSWAAIGFRLGTRRSIPGLLLVGSLGLTVRAAIALLNNSPFVYFLQPTLGTFALAAAFLVSVPAGKPLAARLAADFLPMPDWFGAHPAIRRFFTRVTILWAGVQLGNAALALWLLLNEPITVFLALKTGLTALTMGAAIVVSTVWFRRVLRRHGLAPARAA
jgi:uncharacterized membrane protein